MEFLNIFKKPKSKTEHANAVPEVQTGTSSNSKNHPFSIMDQYKPLSDCHMNLYKTMKEAVPIMDAAISKIVRLVGEFKIKCDDKETELKINNFIRKIKVNACGIGVNSFILSHLNQLLTYGTAIGEIVINPDGIKALYNASLSSVRLCVDEKNPLKLVVYKVVEEGKLKQIKYPDLLLISALNPEPGQVYGNSIMKGLSFVSDILLKIYNTIGVNWERVGNLRFAVTYKPPSDVGEKAYSKERAQMIANEWSTTMQSSTPRDFIAVGDVGIKVIGADNQILESQVPVRQMLEQIISKLSIPPFLLGLNWSTTETMSTQQAEILSSELEAYRRILNPVIQKICDLWLRFEGIQIPYKISWDKIDLKDHVHIANARLLNARAKQIEGKLGETDFMEDEKMLTCVS